MGTYRKRREKLVFIMQVGQWQYPSHPQRPPIRCIVVGGGHRCIYQPRHASRGWRGPSDARARVGHPPRPHEDICLEPNSGLSWELATEWGSSSSSAVGVAVIDQFDLAYVHIARGGHDRGSGGRGMPAGASGYSPGAG